MKSLFNKIFSLLFYLIITVILFSKEGNSQCSIQSLWKDDFNIPSYSGNAYEFQVAQNGDVYVLLIDEYHQYQLSVRKFSGGNWSYVGSPGFTTNFGGTYADIDLDLDGNDVPFVSYTANTSKSYVQMFNGTSWVLVGGGSISASNSFNVSLTIDNTNKPCVFFSDATVSVKGSAKRFDGTNWVYVGSAGFTASTIARPDFEFDPTTNFFYASYSDQSIGGKVTVKKFNGTNWSTVGTTGFSAGYVQMTDVIIDSSSDVIIAYSDASLSNNMFVKKFQAGTWSTLGSSSGIAIASISVDNILSVDSNNIPHLVYIRDALMDSVVVSKYQSGVWSPVSTNTLSYSGSIYPGSQPRLFYLNKLYCYYNAGNINRHVLKSFNGTIWQSESGLSADSFYVNYSPLNYHFSKDDTAFAVLSRWYPVGGGKLSVGKFNGTEWELVGPSNFESDFSNVCMTTDTGGIPYIYYSQNAGGTMNKVRKFDGTNWVQVGNTFLYLQHFILNGIVFDANNVPYIIAHEYNSNLVHVQKYNGTNWVTAGTPFGLPNANMQKHYELYADSNKIYALGLTADHRLSLKLFDGSSTWLDLAANQFSILSISDYKLAFMNGTPYIAFKDATAGNKIFVVKYNGTSWDTVGNTSVNMSNTESFHMTIRHNSIFITTSDSLSNNRAELRTFHNGAWQLMTSEPISAIENPGVYFGSALLHIGNDSNLYSVYSYFIKKLTLNQLPAPGPISGNLIVCAGSNQTYSISPVIGATSYNWSLPIGWQGNSTSNTMNTQPANTNGTIYVSASSICGISATSTISIQTNDSSLQVINDTSCNAYTLNGITYTMSGTYTQIYPNLLGCDSSLKINLVINASSVVPIVNSIACDSFSLNGVTYTTTGTYQQTYTNAEGCDSNINLVLTIYETPIAIIVNNGDTLKSQNIASAYQWIDCSSLSPIIGATSPLYLPLQDGNYALVMSNNICIDTSLCKTVIGVGINQTSLLNKISIVPNPSTSYFNIENLDPNELTSVSISNAIGQRVYFTQTKNQTQLHINSENWKTGIYSILIEQNKQSKVFKFIIR